MPAKTQYKAPDYHDPETGGLDKPNKGNEGVMLSEHANDGKKYATGTQWADEDPGPPDYASPPAGPIAGHKPDAQMKTGEGIRGPNRGKGECPGPTLDTLARARGMNPKGQTVAAANTQATAARPYGAGGDDEDDTDWELAYNGYLRGRADLTEPPLDFPTWVAQEKRIHAAAGESKDYEAGEVDQYGPGSFDERKHPRGKGGKFAPKHEDTEDDEWHRGLGIDVPKIDRTWRDVKKQKKSLRGQVALFDGVDIRPEEERRKAERDANRPLFAEIEKKEQEQEDKPAPGMLFSRPVSRHAALSYARHCQVAERLGRPPMPPAKFQRAYAAFYECPEQYGRPGAEIFARSTEELEG